MDSVRKKPVSGPGGGNTGPAGGKTSPTRVAMAPASYIERHSGPAVRPRSALSRHPSLLARILEQLGITLAVEISTAGLQQRTFGDQTQTGHNREGLPAWPP